MARIFVKYVLHSNGIDPFLTLMGSFNWGPISCNDIVSMIADTVCFVNILGQSNACKWDLATVKVLYFSQIIKKHGVFIT